MPFRPSVSCAALRESSLPDMDSRKRMKQPEDIQEPQHYGNYNDAVQNRLDAALHWNKAIDQPKQNTHYD